jgi:hypothetical protein
VAKSKNPMEPVSYKRNGRELGNAAAAGKICGVSGETYQFYIRRPRSEKASYPPPPGHVYVDVETRQQMYPLKEVRAWQAKRPGRGNWNGEGAGARKRLRDQVAADQPASVDTEPVAPDAAPAESA